MSQDLLLLRATGLLLAVLLMLPAVYCWIVALRIDRVGVFPPPGMKLIREVRVVEGDAARGRAWLLRAIAIKLVLLAVMCSVLVWVLAASLLR